MKDMNLKKIADAKNKKQKDKKEEDKKEEDKKKINEIKNDCTNAAKRGFYSYIYKGELNETIISHLREQNFRVISFRDTFEISW